MEELETTTNGNQHYRTIAENILIFDIAGLYLQHILIILKIITVIIVISLNIFSVDIFILLY